MRKILVAWKYHFIWHSYAADIRCVKTVRGHAAHYELMEESLAIEMKTSCVVSDLANRMEVANVENM